MISTFHKHILYSICLAGAFCFGCSLVSCRDRGLSQYVFESKLRVAIQETSKGETKSFAMKSLTDFPWDGLYVFGPYTSASQIDTALGFPWPPAKESGIELSDSICLLVFTHKNSVVRYCKYTRRDGDWSTLSSTKKISPSSAVFSVREENGLPVVIMAGK